MEIRVRNVNSAFKVLKRSVAEDDGLWLETAPRGTPTLEYYEPVLTHYASPEERVLFDPVRDANPFFHFFEALWILDGREDVAFLQQFNSNIANYSDDGNTFHGAYGQRIRNWPSSHTGPEIDQLKAVIAKLRDENTTRQAVISIWNPDYDLLAKSKDIPCNDLILFKIREGALHTRVICRSNDVVWGAYGANVVQFSTLHEFVARAVGVKVGPYTQYSDSYHIYHEREDWKRIAADKSIQIDPYNKGTVRPFPLFRIQESWLGWLDALREYMQHPDKREVASFTYFADVARPMYCAWKVWKDQTRTKNQRINAAVYILQNDCMASDWRLACTEWLERRMQHATDEV